MFAQKSARVLSLVFALATALTSALTSTPARAATVFMASGAAPADIQTTVDSFRAALGALNPNTSGFFISGRREINWDGVPNVSAAPNPLSGNFFNAQSPRGIVLSTPGTALQVSATTSSGTAVRFGNINPSYATQFQTFSAERLFTAIGSNIVHVAFFVPGTTFPATVSGFGAIFTDVETAGSTKYTVFLGDGSNGGQFSVPTSASGGLSFLGLTDPRRYSRIIIQFGNAAGGAAVADNPGGGTDLVAMDDFIYGEPRAIAPLDVDASVTTSKYAALTDGLIVVRYLLGLTGAALTQGATIPTAGRNNATDVKAYLDAIRGLLDIDGNGAFNAATDGVLVVRYLLGLRGTALVSGAFDPLGSRNTIPLIEGHLQSLVP